MSDPAPRGSFLDGPLRFCLENKLIVGLLLVASVVAGLVVVPFDWDLGGLVRDPVPVDAIPDIGENQQIVFTEWPGRSPQDVEDQISYPLTSSLLGVPGVKTVRSFSMFGFSTIYVIFEEGVDFYWSRSRVLEKLSSLPAGTLPPQVQPALGPDATALGQVFWYTLEGLDPEGNPAGGWDLHELRSVQDWQVRYALMGVPGVSEVASVGGYVQEYQIDVDPDAMRAYGVTLQQVFEAVRMSNLDVGARTIEINRAEYVVRGVGFLEGVQDIENTVVTTREHVPVYVRNVATVGLGPALRRGALDKAGAEAVGGVVVVRYGENPMAVIQRVKERIAEIAPGLPAKTLEDGTVSKIAIVPFYDRTGLIQETLGTLEEALRLEILVTLLVVMVMLAELRSSLLVAGLLPLAVLLSFVAMRLFGVDANIVSLSGIAIAIGTMVDMGVILSENVVRHLGERTASVSRREAIFRASSEVAGAVLTAVATTVVSFLPVFAMEAAEGKLFRPLAFTKTFALIASVVVALFLLPALADLVLGREWRRRGMRVLGRLLVLALGLFVALRLNGWAGAALILHGGYGLFGGRLPASWRPRLDPLFRWMAVLVVGLLLAGQWLPLGVEKGVPLNALFVLLVVGGILGGFALFQRHYLTLLRGCLGHRRMFLGGVLAFVLLGTTLWLGFDRLFGWLPGPVRMLPPVVKVAHAFPGLGKEFMPPLDEGSYLLMPTTMPHASIGEALDVLAKLDMAVQGIPEVESVVGKLGRAESPLDPAPISMIESVINYRPEYILDEDGHRRRFRYRNGEYPRDEHGELIEDSRGRPYRQWREHIHSAEDIWEEIVRVTRLPGTTSAPRLQPIAARLVMLQSGMRAPMGVKVKGPDLETIERVGLQIEGILKQVPSIEPAAVLADRIVGKPYLEIHLDREAIARYGVPVKALQEVIEVAVGGKPLTTTVEGRERYPVRVRYARELRDTVEDLGEILVPTPAGAQIPLMELAEIRYLRGPQVIKSEDTFLTGYVLFDKRPGWAEVEVVEQAQEVLRQRIAEGSLELPAGVSYAFAGSYENQLRSERRLMLVLPAALGIIFFLLYLQFRAVSTTLMVFSGIFVAWSGGFVLVWLYGQPWFLDLTLFGTNLRDLFQIHPLNLSVAVWVGFLALFGIASDDGVVMATYLRQVFDERRPTSVRAIREATLVAGQRRIRPCLMTVGTTILALLPVLSSTGRGSDIMVPMAIPSFGGMLFALLTLFVVPVLYSGWAELRLKTEAEGATISPAGPSPAHDEKGRS